MTLPASSSMAWMFARFALVLGGLGIMQYALASHFDSNEIITWLQVAGVLVAYDVVQVRKAKQETKQETK